MINYYNIKNNMELTLSEDRKISSTELENLFVSQINQQTENIYDFKKISGKQYSFKTILNSKIITFVAIIKNVTGAGWKDKPHIKRVQVRNGLIEDKENISKNNINKLNVIIGIYNYDNNPIFVAWDAYKYYNHKTQRSCYVTVDSLLQGYKKHYYDGVDSSQKIWIFKGEYFRKFAESYREYIGGNNLNG